MNLDQVLDNNFMTSFIQVIITAANTVATIVLFPVSALIHQFLPSIDGLLDLVPQFFVYATQYAGYAINALGIPSAVLVLASTYFTFVLTSSLAVYAIKLGLKWYMALKP